MEEEGCHHCCYCCCCGAEAGVQWDGWVPPLLASEGVKVQGPVETQEGQRTHPPLVTQQLPQ